MILSTDRDSPRNRLFVGKLATSACRSALLLCTLLFQYPSPYYSMKVVHHSIASSGPAAVGH